MLIDSRIPGYTYPYIDGSTGEEWITLKEFRRRMRISTKLIDEKIDNGVFTPTMKNGMRLVEWYATSLALVKSTSKPQYYHPNEIENRRHLQHRRRQEKDIAKELCKPQGQTNAPKISAPASTSPFLIPELKVKTGDDEFHDDMSKREAEAIKQVYQAKQAKLKYLREAGILIKAERVKREWEEIAIRVRKAMLSIPDRVAQLYATSTDPVVIHQNLTTEISHALSRLFFEVTGDNEDVTNLETQTEVNPSYVEAQANRPELDEVSDDSIDDDSEE